MTEIPWTDEQSAVLASTDRITLVQAGPGSGKTKVFAAVVDGHIRAWSHTVGGLAALSFTNVARDEIEERVSAATVAPHFIGTLDAFFLRFVIGPFGHLAGLPASGARLIPSPIDQQIAKPTVAVGNEDHSPLFGITATAGTEIAPEFRYKRPHGLPDKAVVPAQNAWVLKNKRDEWKSKGRVTHGDCSYLAAGLLKGPYGAAIRAMIVRRFPVICIDEFQDTGHFLGRAVLALLAEPDVKALVVGDVDQKIFGFSGVNPNLFEQVAKLPGAKRYPLQISQRCATRVCDVASHLSRSGASVLPKDGALAGRSIVVKHGDPPTAPDTKILETASSVARDAGCHDVAVLVRTRLTKSRFIRGAGPTTVPMNSRGVAQTVRALEALREAKGREAVDIAQAFLSYLFFEEDRPSETEMRDANVDPAVLRQRARRLLLDVVDVRPPETWGQWAARTKGLCARIATDLGITSYKGRLGGAFKTNNNDKPDETRTTATALNVAWPADLIVEVLTIHEAKGREFDCVLLYCTEPRKIPDIGLNCPSATWWAPAATSEEREIAFVAVTRAKRVLVLSVHEKTWNSLKKSREQFLALFEPMP